jgi:integrase
MAKSVLRLVSPATENRTVERSMPSRRPNAEIRPREHLTEREVERLIAAAKGNRWGQRDATMILIAFRHGLRASELCELQWSDVEFETGNLHLRRAKGGATGTHPLLGDELRALRVLKREAKSPFILANKGTDTRTLQAYLGHRSIQSTVRYTELAPGRFKNLWRS